MKKFIKNIIFSILIVILVVFCYLFFVLFPSLSCIDSSYRVSFIKNRITGSCSYTYTCTADPIREFPRFFYTPSCSKNDALFALKKGSKYKIEVGNLVDRCETFCTKTYSDHFCNFTTQNPELNCKEILDNVKP